MMTCEEIETVSVLEKVEAIIAEYDMLPDGCTVIAAVSGGADSMCLLDVLGRLRDKSGFKLSACHFNHCLRGTESDGDAEFVAEYCRKMNIEYKEGRGDVAAESLKTGCGIEETARKMRYRFFEECSETEANALVATAHNADDNAETVLMHLMRGSGAKGLSGIPPRRGIYIRPLLWTARSEIEEYLCERGIRHREDSTNALDDALRNRVRHYVTPQLKAICPQWEENVSVAVELLRKDNDCLDRLAEGFVNKNFADGCILASALNAEPEAVASRAVRIMTGETGIGHDHVKAVLRLALSKDPSGSISIPGMTVRREYDKLLFGVPEGPVTFEPRLLNLNEWIEIPEIGKRFRLENTEKKSAVYNSFTGFLFKKTEVCGNITIRPRTEGDKLHLPGRKNKTLKKLFIEEKIPARRRGSVPVATDEKGVIGVIGIGVDSRVLSNFGDEVYKLIWEDIYNASGC